MARLFGSHDPIQAGEFEIPKGMGGAAILDLLQHGRPVQRLITVTEGMPAIIVSEKLAANPYLAGPMPPHRRGLAAAGQLWLSARRNARRDRQADAGGDDQDARRLWPNRSTDCPILTRDQAVILASIVEKETGKPAERPTIAGVYCNRLRIGMKLDADPTVIYPITKGKPLGRRILQSELNADNGYNTYRRPGLPKGRSPIRARRASRRCFIRPRPRRSISSPTAPAAMCSPTRWPSTMPMSPNGMRSAARGADVTLSAPSASRRT